MPPKKPKGKAEMPATAEELRPVRLALPEDVHMLLRLEAARQDMSLGDLARKLVTDALKANKRSKPDAGD